MIYAMSDVRKQITGLQYSTWSLYGAGTIHLAKQYNHISHLTIINTLTCLANAGLFYPKIHHNVHSTAFTT